MIHTIRTILRQSSPSAELSPAAARYWALLATALLFVVILIRSWHLFVSPSFFVEDILFFNHYYGNSKPLSDVFQHHFSQPYTTLLSNMYAWIVAHFDVRLAPTLYLWSGFAWGIAAASCLFFSGLIRNKAVIVGGMLLLGLSGINHIYYYITNIYTMYTAVAIALALALFPTPQTRGGIFATGLAFLVLPWAGPYSVLLIPVSLFLLMTEWRDSTKRWLLLIAILSTCVYFTTVSGHTTQLANLKKLWVLEAYFQDILEKIFMFGLVNKVSPWWWLPFASFIGGSLYLFRDDRKFLVNSLAALAIVFGSLLLFYCSIKFPLYLYTSLCHRFLSMFFWLFFLFTAIDHYFNRFPVKAPVQAVFLAAIIALIATDNSNDHRRWTVPGVPETAKFLATARTLEQMELTGKSQYVVLKLDNPRKHHFALHVTIGSHDSHAVRLRQHDLPNVPGNRYIAGS